MSDGKRQIPLKEGLFRLPSREREGYLIGSKCRTCGETFFPKRLYCAKCTSSGMDEVALSTRGKLESFTISRGVPPGSVMKAPYGLAQIRLPEGPLVTTVVADCDLEALGIGMDMELVLQKVMEDEQGNEVMAFKFKPA